MSLKLLARWVSETVYRLNQKGVAALLWFGLRDRPFGPNLETQSGLYFCGVHSLTDENSCGDVTTSDDPFVYDIGNDVKKTMVFNSFRFPFVAFANGTKVKVWGKRPGAWVEASRSGGGSRRATGAR